MLSDGDRHTRAFDAAHRRLVTRNGDHDRVAQSFFAKVVGDELLHFAATFTDQCDHVDIGTRLTGNHGEKRALSDARPGEDADALCFAERQEYVDGANARVQWLLERKRGEAGEG